MSKERFKVISEHLFPGNAEDLLSMWTGRHQHFLLSERCAGTHLLELRRLSPQHALDALRIIANTMPTSHRLHANGGVSPCLFCMRQGGDRLAHLVQCPALVSELTRFFQQDPWLANSVSRCAFLGRILIDARHSGATVRQLIRAVWHTLPSRMKAAITGVALR